MHLYNAHRSDTLDAATAYARGEEMTNKKCPHWLEPVQGLAISGEPELLVKLCEKCNGVVSDAPENDGRHDVILDTVKPRTYFYCQCGSKMPKQV